MPPHHVKVPGPRGWRGWRKGGGGYNQVAHSHATWGHWPASMRFACDKTHLLLSTEDAGHGGSISAPGAHRASFFDHSPPVPVFAPPHRTIGSTFSSCLRISPVLCTQFMIMARVGVGSGGSDILCCSVDISAYATCFAGKVCGLVPSIWGTSVGGDKLGARVGYLIQR